MSVNCLVRRFKYQGLCIVLLLFYQAAWAQFDLRIDSLYQAGICTEEGICIPRVKGFSPSKGLEVYQDRVPNYFMTSDYGSSDSSFKNNVRRTKSWFARLRFPILNKDQLKLLVGIKYYQQEFAFQNPNELANTFQSSLQDKLMKSIGTRLYLIRPLKRNHYLAARGGIRFNGDFDEGSLWSYQKTSFTGLYGFKSNAFKTWGLGVSYSNTFGRSSIYPVFFYRNRFREDWTLDALAPVRVRIGHQLTAKNLVYLEAFFEGDNYNINLNGFGDNPLYLEKSDFKLMLRYEREIYDFIWMSLNGGLRINMNFDVSDSDTYFDRAFQLINNNNLVISNTLSESLFFRFGLFLVAPKKLRAKYSNK